MAGGWNRRGKGRDGRIYKPTWIVNDGLEKASQGVAQLVLQIIIGINGNVVLQDIDGIFAPFIGGCAFSCLDDHVRHTVAHVGGRAGVSVWERQEKEEEEGAEGKTRM